MGTFWRALCAVISLSVLSASLACADSLSVSTVSSPEEYLEQGWRSFQQGAFEQAVLSWQEATRLYEQEGKPSEQSEVLTYLSQAYQSIGQYQEAVKSLESARVLAEKASNAILIASILGHLGNAYIATGPAEKASQYLNEGLGKARALGDAGVGLTAVLLNNLGNLLTSQQKYRDAIAAYQESWTLAEKAGNPALVARALTNAAIASLRNGQPAESRALLDKAWDQMQGLENSHDKAYGLITIGLTYRDLHSRLPDSGDALLLRASKAFTEAAGVAEALNDSHAAAYAWGHLGKLYEEEHRYQEALQLTQRATFAAQQANAPESLYRWQWQTGRLLKALGTLDEAIAAYRRAVSTLQSIRQEMVLSYDTPQSSFRESVRPVYFELVDLLLQRAASLQDPQQFEPYLREARDAVESLKVAELRDYFRDDCVEALRARTKPLDVVSQTAVVVYPILLPDRTELLASLPAGPKISLRRFSVQVGADVLTQEVRELRRKLEKRTTREYLPHAQKLYDWLIRPLEADLASLGVNTLVIVPDGPLRTIPMAALHDGRQFLINKYAVATTPGLSLTDPLPLQRERVRVLAVGLTEAVQGFPPLPNVSAELQAIQSLYRTDLLLNQGFLTSRMEKELRDEQLTIVHIASHGRFAGDVEKTFLLTFDGKLTMDQLDQLVGLFRFRDNPLELLTLSACETAAGDDRAALGLAGVAIKAGARSALATLWHIADPASSILVAEFYRQLQDPAVSRAVALQRAQLQLLNNPRYRHPGYWSPFLLINNWL